jgi:hypothetical protein
MATNGERILYLTAGAVAGCVILSILYSTSSSNNKSRPFNKMNPLELRGVTSKLMSAYSRREYYDVAAGLRDVLNDRLNKDGTAKDRPIPKSIQDKVLNRLHLTPIEKEEAVIESEALPLSSADSEN